MPDYQLLKLDLSSRFEVVDMLPASNKLPERMLTDELITEIVTGFVETYIRGMGVR